MPARGASGPIRRARLVACIPPMIATLLALPGSAAAAPQPGAHGADDAGGFYNVLPPGQGQSVNSEQIAAFLGTGARPPHDQDQLRMYDDLVYGAPGVTDATLGAYFKDATFGVREADVEREYSPRDDVTIVRDKFGVPRIYGSGRAGAMFGAGYVAAEDRMFFIDALRHAGRAQLAAFAGGSEGNLEMDREVWADTPYRDDSELQVQFELADEFYGADGAQVQQDVTNFVAGINARISEIRANSSLMPGEYPLLGHPQGPEDWKVTDVISTASLVAGIFGKGGGNEIGSALVLERARKRFGIRRGFGVWKDFRRAEDPEAPVTVRGARFPYRVPPKNAKGRALPDPGTIERHEVVSSSTASTEPAAASAGPPGIGDLLGGLDQLGDGSNALLVSARESESGRPLAVFGPQVSYFSPQILLEMEIHAPGGPEGPPLDARGTAFPGTNLYVQLGHGRDYAWSATSAGQDIIDTFAVRLCEPDGSRPSLASMHYIYRGECLPIDVLERVNSWTQSAGDMTPSGSETYRAERTTLGIVTARARIRGKPVAFTKLRATYYHEVDSALGFADFNNPQAMESPREFMAAACRIDYTFNWFFVNRNSIAYFNSGANPVRAKRADPSFPVFGRKQLEWRGFFPPSPELLSAEGPVSASQVDSRINTSAREPCERRPQTVDQAWITSWNNKQARGYRAADDEFSFGPVFRSTRLDSRVRARLRGQRKMSLPELVDAMADAATVDLRGSAVLKFALKVIGSGRARQSPAVRRALRALRRWKAAGSHRRDRDRDGTYERSEAVRIIDAWWPRWVRAQFRPTLGGPLFNAIEDMHVIHDAPGPVGSAFIDGWYGYVQKDLRSLLGRKVKGRFSREYCGGGRLAKCRRVLVRSLEAALANDSDDRVYPSEGDRDPEDCQDEGLGDAQWCYDAIRHTATGAITQPPIHWQDRPTFQQAVEPGR